MKLLVIINSNFKLLRVNCIRVPDHQARPVLLSPLTGTLGQVWSLGSLKLGWKKVAPGKFFANFIV